MGHKRILVLSGGGSRGAFQAGAVHALLAEGLSFDAFLGVSVGSLNSALLAAHDDQADRLWSMWRTSDQGVADGYHKVFQPIPSKTLEWLADKARRRRHGWLRRLGMAGYLAAPRLFNAIREDLGIIARHARVDAEPQLRLETGHGLSLPETMAGLHRMFEQGMLANGLPVLQRLDVLERQFLQDPQHLPPLEDLWAADAPLYCSFVSLYDGRFFTASTHRSMARYASQLPGFFFLDPSRGWNQQDLQDCIIASAAIPIRMTLRGVRVPDPIDERESRGGTYKSGRGYLSPTPGPARRACGDGGLRSILPLAEALHIADAWLAEGHTSEIWAITNASRDRTLPFEDGDDLLRRLTRCFDVLQEEVLSNDFKDYQIARRALQARSSVQRELGGSFGNVPEDQASYVSYVEDHYDVLADAFRGSRLVDQAPLRILARDALPPLHTIEPDFEAPWTSPDGQQGRIDDLFADLLSFAGPILADRWDHGVHRATTRLARLA